MQGGGVAGEDPAGLMAKYGQPQCNEISDGANAPCRVFVCSFRRAFCRPISIAMAALLAPISSDSRQQVSDTAGVSFDIIVMLRYWKRIAHEMMCSQQERVNTKGM